MSEQSLQIVLLTVGLIAAVVVLAFWWRHVLAAIGVVILLSIFGVGLWGVITSLDRKFSIVGALRFAPSHSLTALWLSPALSDASFIFRPASRNALIRLVLQSGMWVVRDCKWDAPDYDYPHQLPNGSAKAS